MSFVFVRLAVIGASLLVLLSGTASAARQHAAAAQSLSDEALLVAIDQVSNNKECGEREQKDIADQGLLCDSGKSAVVSLVSAYLATWASGGCAARPWPTRSAGRAPDISERCFNKLKQFRHIAMRFDRNPLNYLAMIKLASTRLWLRVYESAA